jgi:hypothetical protein
MDDRGIGVRFPVSLLYDVQTGSDTQPPLKWAPAPISPREKLQVCEADHSPSSSADVKNGGAIRLLPHTSSWYGKVR